MHDWTLLSVHFEWELARVTFNLGIPWDPEAPLARLVANGVVELHVPRRDAWGPSKYIIGYSGPSDVQNGARRLTIEMQSGDAITVTARKFDIPPASTYRDPSQLPLR